MSARRRPADRADVSGKRRQVRRAGAAVFCPRRTRRVASRLRCFGASVCPLSCEYFGTHLSCIKQGVSHQSRCAVQQGAGELAASAARAEAAFFDSPTNQLVCRRRDRARSVSRPARAMRRAIFPPNPCRLAGRGFAWSARYVSCVACALAGTPGRFPLPHAPDGADSDVAAGCRICVSDPQHFASVDSCDANDAACRGNPSCMTGATRSIACRALHGKSSEPRQRKAFRKMREVRRAIDARNEFVIDRTMCRMDRATDRMFVDVALAGRCELVAVVKHSETRCMCTARTVRTEPGRRAAGLNIAVVVVT